MYQPQVASWESQKHLVAYSAVSYLVPGAEKPALGSVRLEGDTKVSVSDRLVSFSGIMLKEASFPSLPKDNVREVTAEIDKAIPDQDRVIALDRVLASIDKSQIMPKNVEGVKADPPTIFFSERPAILVNLDGEPIWSPIKENDLKYAVNTNWDLFQHGVDKQFYLRNEGGWLKAADLKGPWQPAGKLPDSFGKLPKDDNWKDVLAALPGKSMAAAQIPTVNVSTTPAEMLLLRGKPSYVTVGNTKLMWVNNTESDVFRLGVAGPVYYLVAGRWFSAPGLQGPVDVRHAEPAGRLPADSAGARALSCAGVRAGHAAGGRGRAAGAGAADGEGQQEGTEGPRGRLSGRPEVRVRSRARRCPTR